MSPPRPWTVDRHRPIVRLEDNLWTVDGEIRLLGPWVRYPRKMTLIRLKDGRVVVHSGIPLSEPSMAELERWGEPAYYIAPNAFHRQDAHAYRVRYPNLRVVCPAPSRRRVEALVSVDGGYELLPDELPSRPLPMRTGECVFLVRAASRLTLLFADALINVPHQPGLLGAAFRLGKLTGDARVSPISKLALVTNRRQMARIFEDLAGLHGLVRLIPGHGAAIETDPAGTMRRVAARI